MPLPVHVPGFAVSDSPTTADPEIVGGAVFGGVWEMRERLNAPWRTWMTVELRR